MSTLSFGAGTLLTSGATSAWNASSAVGWVNPVANCNALRASATPTAAAPVILPSGSTTFMLIAGRAPVLPRASVAVTVMLLTPSARPAIGKVQAVPVTVAGAAAPVPTATLTVDPASTVPPMVWVLTLDTAVTGLRVKGDTMVSIVMAGAAKTLIFPAESVASTDTVCAPSASVAMAAPDAGVGVTIVPSTLTVVTARFLSAAVKVMTGVAFLVVVPCP